MIVEKLFLKASAKTFFFLRVDFAIEMSLANTFDAKLLLLRYRLSSELWLLPDVTLHLFSFRTNSIVFDDSISNKASIWFWFIIKLGWVKRNKNRAAGAFLVKPYCDRLKRWKLIFICEIFSWRRTAFHNTSLRCVFGKQNSAGCRRCQLCSSRGLNRLSC